VIKEETIDIVHRRIANTSIALDPEKSFANGKHRMTNPGLAGGALLDPKPYILFLSINNCEHTTIS